MTCWISREGSKVRDTYQSASYKGLHLHLPTPQLAPPLLFGDKGTLYSNTRLLEKTISSCCAVSRPIIEMHFIDISLLVGKGDQEAASPHIVPRRIGP